jgi:adenosylhomocysteine nucleosidase
MELMHLRGALQETRGVGVAHAKFYEGTLDGHEVVLAEAGVGKVNAAIVTTILADGFDCHAVVLSGVAGGLDPRLHIGDVVIADRTVQHDARVIEDKRLQSYQPGHVPFINPTERLGYPIDPELHARIRGRLEGFNLPSLSAVAGGNGQLPRVVFGTVVTGDHYLHCAATREACHRELGGRAVEMEGGAVAQVSEAFGIPWVVIRALSVLAGHDSSFDFISFADAVAANSASILRRLLPVL